MGFFLLVLGGVLGAVLAWLYLDAMRSRKAGLPAVTSSSGGSSGNDAQIAQLSQQVSECAAARQSLEAEVQSLKRVREENEALKARIAEFENGKLEANGPSIDELPTLTTTSDAPPDDLTIIKGIGPVLKGKLNKLGFTTFQQIADLSPEQKSQIEDVLSFKGRIEREEWIDQAKRLAAEKSG